MHSLTIGKTTFHFNSDLSGGVHIDMDSAEGSFTTLPIPFDDIAQFVARARVVENRGRINVPKNPERAAKRAAMLDKVKEQVIELLKAEQEKLLGEETELTRKMFQVAINAVNGAR